MTPKTAYSMLEKQFGSQWHSHDIEARHHFNRADKDGALPTNMLENTAYFWARFDAEYALALAEKLKAHGIACEHVMGEKHHVPDGQIFLRIAPDQLDAVRSLANQGNKPLVDQLIATGLNPKPAHGNFDMKPPRAQAFLAKQLGGKWSVEYANVRQGTVAHYTAEFDLNYSEALLKLLEKHGFRADSSTSLKSGHRHIHITPAQLRDVIMPLADTSPAKLNSIAYQLEEQLGLPHGDKSVA